MMSIQLMPLIPSLAALAVMLGTLGRVAGEPGTTLRAAFVDDFLIVPDRRATHVCNAPSPAATSSLEIGRLVAEQVPDVTPERVPSCSI